MSASAPAPAPAVPSRTATAPAGASGSQGLPDGSTARIRHLGDLHHLAEIVHDGSVLGTMEADGRDAGLDTDGVYVVLGAGGEISAHA